MKFPHGSFAPEQIEVLQRAFDGVCRELHINDDDADTRDKIAHALIAVAKVGEFDPERLRVAALTHFKNLSPK